jgi:hypothetical protein
VIPGPAVAALGYRERGAAHPPRRATLVALASAEVDLEPWLAALATRRRVVVLEAPRRCDPRRFGVPARAGQWFLGPDAAPDPLSFGLCLEQLERFLLAGAAGSRPFWLGGGQGATLALALGCCWRERLSGIVAVGGAFPELPAAMLQESPLAGLPVWLVGAPDPGRAHAAAALRARGAHVRAWRAPLPAGLAGGRSLAAQALCGANSIGRDA